MSDTSSRECYEPRTVSHRDVQADVYPLKVVCRGPPGSIRAEGTIKNYNTAQDFRSADYNAVKTSAGKQVRSIVHDYEDRR
jgi:hypothetical protein